MSEAADARADGRAGKVFRMVMAAGLLLTLAANLPGQMSLDSVVALTEARTGVRQTWAPPVASWVLKPFDGLLSGTGLYVAASSAILFLSLMSLSRLRPRASWLAVILGALTILTPQLLIYQGIVWRDVLFANLTIAGFVLLAHSAQRWTERPPWPLLAGALASLTLAALARQNGLVLVVAAAAVVAWTARGADWRKAAVWGLAGLVAAGALALAVNRVATPPQTIPKLRLNAASLILEHFDVVGAKVHHPRLPLKEIGKVDPAARALIDAQAAKMYTPARVDTLDFDETFRRTLWHVPDAAMHAQWRRIIVHFPAAYLLQRADVFRWTFLTPRLDLCLPVQVGVSGPDAMLKDLDIQAGVDTRGQALAAYARRFYGTPVFSHLAWALAAIGVIVLLWRRREPADWVLMALMAGSLAFTASFFLISVACDYRYLYVLDLAAITGVLYTALDPPRWRKTTA
ncbi:MAG: hypothetical protein ACJ798_02315 [Phenylobacterium sp.]